MKSTFVVTWTGIATWAGPTGTIDSAARALAVAMGMRSLGMRDIVIREDQPDGAWRTITLAELEALAQKENAPPRQRHDSAAP